ncbi:hypothetical protein B5P41_31445 [Bacillus sp. SRB_28]|nr:hypothetical protein B5P41_31445 [Bacillus sp. SRB_28]
MLIIQLRITIMSELDMECIDYINPWRVEDDAQDSRTEIAKSIQTREELERIAAEKASGFGRLLFR